MLCCRKCDRHWYETGDETLKFSEDQLAEIRSVSMAGLVCRNMDENTMIPRYCNFFLHINVIISV